ncbi:hypothetical protein VPH35_007048 [Triticum aestivum]|uniref:Uncharacterized protein n=1 Tax=Triticum aestivum TaxID=4565 RepID=A0A3B5YTW9_WHEAT|nr:uncharacterized protein LOC123087568 [Triticum aestivum]
MASAAEATVAQDIASISSSDGQQRAVISDTLLPPKQGLEIYIGTSFAVMAAYVLLLMISTRYIKIAVIPAIILVFIGALWGKFCVKGRLRHSTNEIANLGSGSEKPQGLLLMVLLSYCLQLMQLALARLADLTNGQQKGNFVVSHFLLFFSSALGALALMMATLPIRCSPGVAQAQQALHRTFTVVLMISVHTVATEWTGEDMVLICMPELIAALVWFTANFDHGGCTVSVNMTTSVKSSVIALGGAVTLVAYHSSKFLNESEIPAEYWYTRILRCGTLSGVLSYFSVWMIHQWPGSTASAKMPVQLLDFSALFCFSTSAILIANLCTEPGYMESLSAYMTMLGQWVNPEPGNISDREAIICSALCIMFLCMLTFYASGTGTFYERNMSSKFRDSWSRLRVIVLVFCALVLTSTLTSYITYTLTRQDQE